MTRTIGTDGVKVLNPVDEVKSLSERDAPEGTGASATSALSEAGDEGLGGRVGRYRWVICALLFFATTINYIDRQVLGILAKPLQQELGWSESDYGYIAAAFTGAYAVGLVVVGRVMDWLGTRKGFSLAAMGHAFARTAFGFGIARFALGLGEAGNF